MKYSHILVLSFSLVCGGFAQAMGIFTIDADSQLNQSIEQYVTEKQSVYQLQSAGWKSVFAQCEILVPSEGYSQDVEQATKYAPLYVEYMLKFLQKNPDSISTLTYEHMFDVSDMCEEAKECLYLDFSFDEVIEFEQFKKILPFLFADLASREEFSKPFLAFIKEELNK